MEVVLRGWDSIGSACCSVLQGTGTKRRGVAGQPARLGQGHRDGTHRPAYLGRPRVRHKLAVLARSHAHDFINDTAGSRSKRSTVTSPRKGSSTRSGPDGRKRPWTDIQRAVLDRGNRRAHALPGLVGIGVRGIDRPLPDRHGTSPRPRKRTAACRPRSLLLYWLSSCLQTSALTRFSCAHGARRKYVDLLRHGLGFIDEIHRPGRAEAWPEAPAAKPSEEAIGVQHRLFNIAVGHEATRTLKAALTFEIERPCSSGTQVARSRLLQVEQFLHEQGLEHREIFRVAVPKVGIVEPSVVRGHGSVAFVSDALHPLQAGIACDLPERSPHSRGIFTIDGDCGSETRPGGKCRHGWK